MDDENAFAELTKRYLKPVYNFVCRLSGSAHDAEDITQDTFLKAWKNLKKYRPEENFKTWIFTIARNTTIDWFRKKKDHSFSEFETANSGNVITDTLADNSPLPNEILATAENKDFADNLLKKLSPENREILLLHYNNDLTFKEIAKILGKPLNTVKSQYRRALIVLKKTLIAPK